VAFSPARMRTGQKIGRTARANTPRIARSISRSLRTLIIAWDRRQQRHPTTWPAARNTRSRPATANWPGLLQPAGRSFPSLGTLPPKRGLNTCRSQLE
jgi:hypothetical protein